MVGSLSPFSSARTGGEDADLTARTAGGRKRLLLWVLGLYVLRRLVRRRRPTRDGGGASEQTERRESAQQSAGRGRRPGRRLFGAAVLVAVGYLARRWLGPVGGRVRGRLDEAASMVGEQTEGLTQTAADRVRGGGDTVAERTQETMGQATDRMQSTGEEVGRQVEDGSEELGQQIEDVGERAGEMTNGSEEGSSTDEAGDT